MNKLREGLLSFIVITLKTAPKIGLLVIVTMSDFVLKVLDFKKLLPYYKT